MKTPVAPRLYRLLTPLLLALSAAGFAPYATAQTTGALYDPQPPADSAYVRIIVVSADGPMDVQLDGKPRLQGLAAATASDYMVLKAGQHQLKVQGSGKSSSTEIPLEVVAGRSVTVALAHLGADSKPLFFADKANSNKLKAVLTVYHLAPKAGVIDIQTADGNTKVFAGVAPGTSSSLAVNPVTIELQASKVGDKTALAKAPLTMTQGLTYSLLVLPGEGDKLVMKSSANALERYTGK
jgi:alginate O-acetyltransferase complex protein AlgF